MKRYFAIWACCALLAVGLTACGSSAGSTVSSAVSKAGSAVSSTASKAASKLESGAEDRMDHSSREDVSDAPDSKVDASSTPAKE